MLNFFNNNFELSWIRSHEGKRIKSYLKLVNSFRFISVIGALVFGLFIFEFFIVGLLGILGVLSLYYFYNRSNSVSFLKKIGIASIAFDICLLATTLFLVDRVSFERGTYIIGVLIIIEGAALGRVLGGVAVASIISLIITLWAVLHPYELDPQRSLLPLIFRPVVMLIVGASVGVLSKILSSVTEDLAQRVASSELVSKFAIESAKQDPDTAAEILSNIILEDFDFDRVTFYEEEPASGAVFRISSTHDLPPNATSDLSFVKNILIPEIQKLEDGMYVRIPIRRGTRKVGLLECYIKDYSKISNRDIRILENTSSELTQLIDQSRLWHLQRQTIGELETLNDLKDDFVAIASHELRTPVTAMRGFLSILGKENLTPDDRERALAGVDRQSRRMQSFIEDILAVGMIDAHKSDPNKTNVELVGLIKDILHDVSIQTSEHKVEFEMSSTLEDYQGTKITINSKRKSRKKVNFRTDRTFLTRIITNLVVNASRYSPSDSKIILKLYDSEDQIEIEVQDFGIGIADENITHIFSKFQRLGETRQSAGSGLGLYIVSGLVTALGGEIKVDSKVNEGTTFSVYLPKE